MCELCAERLRTRHGERGTKARKLIIYLFSSQVFKGIIHPLPVSLLQARDLAVTGHTILQLAKAGVVVERGEVGRTSGEIKNFSGIYIIIVLEVYGF